jgi:ankyrin repeat protein
MNKILSCLILSLIIFGTRGPLSAADQELLAAIRDGDETKVTALLRSGADPNMRDQSGTTPLMYAAAFASPEMMRLILDGGGAVNAANQGGSTALMWSTYDASKVALLLERHADVNASRPDGVTALISAALRGNTQVMKMLIAAGADKRKGLALAPWPMDMQRIVLTTNDPAMQAFLDPADKAPANLTPLPGPPPLGNMVLTSVFSWRPQPAGSNAALVRALVNEGANPNEMISQLTLVLPLISRAARLGDIETVRLLLARGADPNLAGPQGLTPLMMAAATDPRPDVVRLLLDHGAAVEPHDASGNSALDWALRLGESETTRVLRKAGAKPTAKPVPIPSPPGTLRTVRSAMEAALSRLQPTGPPLHTRSKCISCHNQSLPAVAVKLADAKGVQIDRTLAAHPTQATLEVWRQARENMMVGHCGVFGFVANVTYGLFALAEEGVAPNSVTDAVASCLSGLQKPDGSWESGDARPPLSGRNPIVYTALALRGLTIYSPPGRRLDMEAHMARAAQFLRKATPDDTQAEAFKLLGLVWAGAPQFEIANQRQRLVKLQHGEGGWGQWPNMPSDAYATGQALYALRVSGEQASSASHQKGVQYLLRTQLEDGTWFVRSRAIGFQPYVDTGFPHGPDQFISAAATSWAVIALSHAL